MKTLRLQLSFKLRLKFVAHLNRSRQPKNELFKRRCHEMLYKVDSSSGDVVIYWTVTSTHVVPDRKQYDERTHQADVILV